MLTLLGVRTVVELPQATLPLYGMIFVRCCFVCGYEEEQYVNNITVSAMDSLRSEIKLYYYYTLCVAIIIAIIVIIAIIISYYCYYYHFKKKPPNIACVH